MQRLLISIFSLFFGFGGTILISGSVGYLLGMKKMLWFEVPDMGVPMSIVIILIGVVMIFIAVWLTPNNKK
ncbi:MAG: hypothetical protein Q7R84_02020 [bacterium]|nr:hypothetical protein [bacterium]